MSLLTHDWLISAIVFQPDKIAYTVDEGDSVNVCVMMIGESEQSVDIVMSTLPNSAGIVLINLL